MITLSLLSKSLAINEERQEKDCKDARLAPSSGPENLRRQPEVYDGCYDEADQRGDLDRPRYEFHNPLSFLTRASNGLI